MQPSDFSPAAPGRVVQMHTGFWAYVPNPLPPSLDSTWQLAGLAAEAHRQVGELAGLARTLPNPHLLIRPFVRREAVLSSRIEGTQASLSDLFFFEAAATPAQATGDVLEVANYVKALEYGLTRLADLPVSLLWDVWIEYFLAGVCSQAQDARDRSKRLLDLRETYRDRLQSARASALLLRLVDELFAAPAVTIPRAAAVLDVTPRAAQLNVDKLVGAGVLHEASGRRRNRIFVAREIVATLEQVSTQ